MIAASMLMELIHPARKKKSGPENVQSQIGINSRLPGSPWSQLSDSFGADQQWRHADGTIMEQRKEKSRDAARSRRGKENYEFYELAKMLPLPQAITSQLDKASIIRLTISYLKLKDFTAHGDPPWQRELNLNKVMKGSGRHRALASLTMEMFEQHQGTHILQSLDGFALSLAADGRFLYVSETVSIYLGLSQVEMTGSSVFDYIHTEDHQEMADQLCLTLATGQRAPSPVSQGSEDNSVSSQGTMNPDVLTPMNLNNNSPFKGYERAFCIRMKSTLTKRGCHFKSCSGFRVVLILGHMRPQHVYVHNRKTPQIMGFVALVIALPPPSIHEVRLETDMFVTRLNFDFRIAHCEPKVSDLLDYQPEELQGRSLYSLSHAEDVDKIKKTHEDLIKKGQVMSPYFRLLNKRAGYTWMQICATVICNSKNSDDQNIICINYVISPCQYKNLVFDETQMDPTLVNMKADNVEYSSTVTPDVAGDMPRVREEPGHCPSPPEVSGTLCETNSPQSNAVPEVSVTPHRSSPDTSSDAAPVKIEVPVNMITPIATNEMQDDSRMDHSDKPSPRGRVSSAPSTPVNSHARNVSNASLTSTPILDVSNQIRGEEGSVRELEAAMTRHLPEEVADFSTDALLRSSGGGLHGSRSTIQWVGNGSQQSSLPASTLLRQLYANRESVIRTSIPRSYYPDVQAALPTPPGHDGYQESIFAKSHDFSYSSNGVSLSNPVGHVGMGGTYADFHSAMTPPSSVSPREKMSTDCNDLRSTSSYLSDLSGNLPAQSLPLKPQVYSYGPSTVGLDASAYPSSLSDQTSGLYPSTSFHLYHANPNKSSGSYDSLRTGPSWYPSTS